MILRHVLSATLQSVKNKPGSINIVASPSPKPGPITLLLMQQERQSTPESWMLGNKTQCGEGFQSSAGNITGAGINHCIMVRKRNLSKKPPIAPAVKGSPATVVVLHAQHPTQRPLHNPSLSSFVRFIREADLRKGSQYLKGIVHIGIKLICILEIPPARFAFGVLDLPVANRLDLFFD